MRYWLVKSEPNCYSIEDFRKEKVTAWSGVRNYAARNNLKAMQVGDRCFFYRSIQNPAIEGLCEVVKPFYPDPTDENWVAVDLAFVETFDKALLLKEVRKDPFLQEMELLNNSRLSVQKVSAAAFAHILTLTQ